MSLRVIGAGWGRTGTTSLRKALELLGLGPCYHWSSVREKDVALWRQVTLEESFPWEQIFDGFSSAVDWPASHYWRELATRYPEAKVILTHRDPHDWFKSANSTIYAMVSHDLQTFDGSGLGWAPETAKDMVRVTRNIAIERALGAPFEERPHENEALVVERFQQHLETVRASLPSERLLDFQVSEGWGPLCEFLEVDVPDEPFPHVNARARFRDRNKL